ncbi:MAG: hypothetical protein AB1730_20800 [Myxococcota bacterium]|jgi:hypothetical protein
MSDDRIDFGPLDPKQDELRYERLVRGVMARARRPGLGDTVSRFGVRALAVAAGLALLAWVPVLARGEAPEPTQASSDPVTVLADLAAQGNAAAAASWFVSGGANE